MDKIKEYGAYIVVSWDDIMKAPVEPMPLRCHCTIFNTEPDCPYCNVEYDTR
jgi:hypothetical protein